MQDLTSKWKTIRDNYTRNLKKQDEYKRSGSAATKIRQYVYSEQLSFLRRNKELRITHSSFERAEEDEAGLFDEIEQDSVTCVDDSINHERTAKTLIDKITNKRKKPNVEHALIEFMESHKETKKTYGNEDEDLALFYSTLPSVKSLTMDEKFAFRMQTMQLLQNLKKPKQRQYVVPTSNIHVLEENRPQSSASHMTYHSQFSSDLSNESFINLV